MKLVVDTNGAELPSDIAEALHGVAASIGAELVEGPINACGTCGFFDCVCEAKKAHKPGCRYLLAASCPVSFECEAHGFDVCPECDACNCKDLP